MRKKVKKINIPGRENRVTRMIVFHCWRGLASPAGA
jgi:hypothetical protein